MEVIEKNSFRSSTRNQYFATISVNLIAISFGSFCGWPSASFLTLQSEESPLETGPMSNSEVGWVASMLSLGGLCGNIFFAWLSDVIGRKRSLQLIAIPALIAWLIIPFARCPTHLCISRFLGGFSGGGTFSLISVYTTEIADDRIRGNLGVFLSLALNLGVLLAFIMGPFYRYDTVALMLAPFSVLFLISFSFMPETPPFLLKQNKEKEAAKSLKFFRTTSMGEDPSTTEYLRIELEKCKIENTTSADQISLSWNDFNNRITLKAVAIAIGIIVLNEFTGCPSMICYTGTIFKLSGSYISPNNSAIMVGMIDVFGSCLPLILVERVGRKFLLTSSALGIGIGHLSLGTYIYLSSLGYDLDALNWIPVVSFSFSIFCASGGLMALIFLVVSEIMPPRVRSVGCMISMAFIWSLSFNLLRFLPQVADVFGMHVVILTFCACSFLAAIFFVKFVPETRGKSFEEIMKLI